MASLSSEYILDDIKDDNDSEKERTTALRLSLNSAAGGNDDPLLMADKETAEKRPVFIERLVNSWN